LGFFCADDSTQLKNALVGLTQQCNQL